MPHSHPTEDLLRSLDVSSDVGLSDDEVLRRRAKYGENRLQGKKKKSLAARFLDQFRDVMILILIAAALVSFVLACIEGNPREFFEPALILLIVLLNAALGVFQESRAEKALEALKNMSAPHARVLRNGTEKILDAAELVPGDIIRLEAGDFVPADARLLRSAGCKSEESALTGESVPAEKDADAVLPENAPLGDRVNMVFSGCSITYGTATALVTGTGMKTEMGRIAGLLSESDDSSTPLQKKLAQLGKYLGFMALFACAVIFVIGLIADLPPMEIFMTAVSLAVSAIPEGLPAIVTIVLSIGVQRMVKRNALIRRLPAVETLGSASVICSDKTGTLTQNRMTLVRAWSDGEPESLPVDQNCPESIRKLLRYATLCCDGSIVLEDGEIRHIGDPTETAIVLAAYRNGMTKEELNRAAPRIAELPFDSDRKRMSTVNETEDGKIVIVKGAFDLLAPLCTAGDVQTAAAMVEQMSAQALRVLAVACKKIDALPDPLTPQNLESGLTLLGLVGMIDPPRPEAKEAVATCRRAGIKPVMITGDHVVTAAAIAREIGILTDGDRAITGAELDAMSDAELDAQVEGIAVYARVSPENKIRIVRAWQRRGRVVSMTGDGVNDAPALKAADIGCAMGITGTDVAKGAADMTLTDDNFATIVEAVREGRGIYANIRKVVGFLLGTNIGEVIAVFLAMLFWQKSPLLSMQLLWINLVTDSLPAVALGMEAVEQDIMDRKPKPKNEGIFAHGLGIRVVFQGLMFALLALFAYRIGENMTGTTAGGQTMAFMVLAISQVAQAYNMRSDHSLFRIGPFGNRTLNGAVLISLLLMALVLFTPVRIAFGLLALSPQLYLIGLGLALVPFPVMELSKLLHLIRPHPPEDR